jgi:hypothetical protein
MSRLLWKSLLAGPAVLGGVLAIAGSAVAAETASIDALSRSESVQLAQVTSVSELSDVQPTDWAHTALQRLVEEYGCIEGYPDRTYRGNRALTRYEFAAGLNACLDVVVQLIGSLDTTELDTIKRLQEEFAAELATLRGRVDVLEADIAELQAHQFSTTTKLNAQLDAHLVVPINGANLADTTGDGNGQEATTFEYRARLNFDTSFTGKDRLRVRLQASDRGNPRSLQAAVGGLRNQSGPTTTEAGTPIEDGVKIDDLYYRFPTGDRLTWAIGANSYNLEDMVSSTIVPWDGPAVADISKPQIYRQFSNANSFSASVNVAFTDDLILNLGYATNDGQTPSVGIFEDNQWIAQLNWLADNVQAAVSYIDSSESAVGDSEYIVAGLLNFSFGDFNIGGFYAYSPTIGGGNADSWQVGFALDDAFGLSGSQLGIYGGESPGNFQSNSGSYPYVIEGYWEVPINEYLAISPAIIYGNLATGDPVGTTGSWYGVIRTTFRY